MIFKNNKECFIIAEVSANHGQDFQRAVAMIKMAKACGADAVKFQAYDPDSLTIDISNKYFSIHHPKWGGQTLYKLYQKAYTPWDWFPKLKKIADKEGIIFFATAFDKKHVDLLEEIKVPFHKIASFELVDIPLIEYVARTKKPLIMSTGMSSVEEINDAVSAARKGGAKDIALLKCVSCYPAKPEEMNLRTIPDMYKRFKCSAIGLSDHTATTAAAVAAISLGATIVEKHFTLSRVIQTPDSFFSIEPKELKELVDHIRIAEKALGQVHYGLTEEEKKSRIFRRSLFAVEDIKKGDRLTESNVRSIRPANGMKPKYLKSILGKKAQKNIKAGTPFQPDFYK
jgi:pseudaminic acid synthase